MPTLTGVLGCTDIWHGKAIAQTDAYAKRSSNSSFSDQCPFTSDIFFVSQYEFEHKTLAGL